MTPAGQAVRIPARSAGKSGELHDGMYFDFHHHFRDGDYVINMVMQEVSADGHPDIRICATSMGAAHDSLEPLIKQEGVIAGISPPAFATRSARPFQRENSKAVRLFARTAVVSPAIEEERHPSGRGVHRRADGMDEYGNARAVGG